ncbi:MAG: helix-turn-helix transcriptional regulator [Oscillospiraceae bacterium]|nr:helix-turn-helix transcriptional regulator [Oscillospiraceae bacterium]
MAKTLGAKIAQLRKQHGMTQLELAEKMGVTDKAVSKWERDLSCPDISTLPRLAETFSVSVDDLMEVKKEASAPVSQIMPILEIAPKAVALAMGIAVTVLTVLDKLDTKSGMMMLGIGLACVGISLIKDKA